MNSDYLLKSDTGEKAFDSGHGFFTAAGGYVVKTMPSLPYSNVVAMKNGGFVAASNGAGFTYFSNSRENKVSEHNNDPSCDVVSEAVLLVSGQDVYRINSMMWGSCKHDKHMTTYYNSLKNIRTRVSQYMVRDGTEKVYKVKVKASTNMRVVVVLDIDLSLGALKGNAIEYIYHADKVVAKNIANNQSVTLKTFGGELIKDKLGIRRREGYVLANEVPTKQDINIPAFAARYDLELKANEAKSVYFVIKGDFRGQIQDQSQAHFENNININTGDKHLDMFFNQRLLTQTVVSRIHARCGFYQAGGAIGYRDQLQDVMALVYSQPDVVREHILLAASRQYVEGDVMHWWHPPKFGVRTNISDDKLFLPYVTFFYVLSTGDYSILDQEVEYLYSEPLRSGEHSRLESPMSTDKKGSILEHCQRAIESALMYGPHGLLLIGTGDWNDALDNIGEQGKGESVWLSMFAYKVLNMYKDLQQIPDRLKYVTHELALKKAVDSYGFDGEWYRRAFTDQGQVLGSRISDTCRIDLICQSYAVLSQIASLERVNLSLDAAYRYLVDKDKKIVKLLEPPFEQEPFYGYISSYPKGVRENGGQYTHAVMWYISALFKAGKADMAYQILQMINPSQICSTKEGSDTYLAEPYVIAADVSLTGKAGWTWYTGSAALMYRVILEDLLGITLTNGNLKISPNLPSQMPSCQVQYRHKNAVYNISMSRGSEASMHVNGMKINHGNIIKLQEEGEVTVEVVV